MTPRELIDFTTDIGKLKTTYRHCYTETDRRESVADHSWRIALMAMLCKDEFPEIDINKVIKMCLIHDFGEAITGDIPAFLKTAQNEIDEDSAVVKLLSEMPSDFRNELQTLFDEINARITPEAKLFKSLDNLEALVSHNEADISTWLPREYEENLTYGQKNCEWSDWTKELKEEIKKDSIRKIDESRKIQE